MWGCWLAVAAGIAPHRGGCSTGWCTVLGQGMGQRVVNSRGAKIAPLNKEKGGEKMRPLSLRAWGENPYGKWRDHPLFEQTTMYICDFYSEKQLSESEGRFCVYARET